MQNVTFGANPTQHITQRAASLLWSMVVAASCYGEVSHQQGLGHWSGYKGKWMEKNTDKSERKFSCPLQESWNWDGIHLLAWWTPEAHSQRYTGVAQEQKGKCPWVSQLEPWPKSNQKSVAWLEKCCPSMLPTQLDWAWTILCSRMGKYCPIKVCKVGRDISQQTQCCNCWQRCFHQVLTQGGGYLSN